MTETNRKASATARTRATTKYHKAHYKRMYISTTPDQADYIRETAKKYDITIVQLIIDSIKLFEENAERLPAGAATPSGTAATTQPEQQAQPEQDPTESTIELGETAGVQPEEETEEDEETTEEEAEDIPEELKAVRAAWARMGAFNEKITAERKRREAEERKRRREGAEEDIYLMR